MKQVNYFRVGICVVAMLLPVIVSGCGKSGEDAATGASPAPVASPMDARIQALSDEQAKGREADAKKQTEAMKRMTGK